MSVLYVTYIHCTFLKYREHYTFNIIVIPLYMNIMCIYNVADLSFF